MLAIGLSREFVIFITVEIFDHLIFFVVTDFPVRN